MQQNTINPDVVCQQAVQAKLGVYQGKEYFETALKTYNDLVDNLIRVIELMKNRILELEREAAKARETDGNPAERPEDAAAG